MGQAQPIFGQAQPTLDPSATAPGSERKVKPIAERLKSPGRDERFSIFKTPDFATRVHFFVICRLDLVRPPEAVCRRHHRH